MRFGKDLPRSSRSLRRTETYRPRAESLEPRQLLAVDLSTVATSNLGILESGRNSSGGAGYSVTDVGDTNGDGYDDYVIGAPTVVANGNGVGLGSNAGTRAYLVFGSNQVGSTSAVDFLGLTSQQRVGDLVNVGNTTQTNPIAGGAGFAFNGLIFETGSQSASELGASVAAVGDVNGDGLADFMIGAPGGNDSANTSNGAGRAYLVYGTANLNRTTKLVDLDTPTSYSDLNIITFANTLSGAASGFSVGSAGNVLGTSGRDIAIGAPNASVAGGSSGAVYVVANSAISTARTTTLLLNGVGQTTNAVAGLIFAGAQIGDKAGFAVAAAGNVSGTNAGGVAENDLLIGAPQIGTGAGGAYLIYSSTTLASSTVTANGYSYVNLNAVGGLVNGAVFTGTTSGDETGYSVSTAGNYTGSTFNGFLIGSPGYTTNGVGGRVNLVLPQTASSSGFLTGTMSLTTLTTNLGAIEFDGTAGSLAGTSVGATYTLTTNVSLNDILIGAPGLNTGAGAVYILPGNPSLAAAGGTYQLSNTGSGVLGGLILTLNDPTPTVDHLGTSVSGVLALNASNRTGDSDQLGDIIVGAAGTGFYSGGFILEGGALSSSIVAPVSNGITSPIGVGQVFGPFTVNATTPPALRIYILSSGSNTADFQPFRDIDPTTIAVNGIALPTPTSFTQDIDEDGDGIRDAYFSFDPRTLLGLTAGTATITVTAKTLATSPFAGRTYLGLASVTVTGGSNGGGGGGGGLAASRNTAFANQGATNLPNLPFGEQLVPSAAILNTLNYTKVPAAVTRREFLPKGYFALRQKAILHPGSVKNPTVHSTHKYSANGEFTLGNGVASRGLSPGTHAYKGVTRKRK